ncbi:MAG: DUF4188 domain-containing protein [Acidobacteriota bacterium]|nr:DUF4188 domain-containing protein [Acidobacteriota bacterium]MDQ7087915.1 DUF4188 domain-containing protein [Acidobacteriota bacterium]
MRKNRRGIVSGAVTAIHDRPFVVLLVGLRINKWWRVDHAWQALRVFRRLHRELEQNPAEGLLAYQWWWGHPMLSVQYWESWEHVEAWARRREGGHRQAWTDYAQRLRPAGSIGVWHETYIIEPGKYETVYNAMPLFGLGRAVASVVPARGRAGRASGRIALGGQDLTSSSAEAMLGRATGGGPHPK